MMSRSALASIHFEKYSTTTAAYLKLPGAVGRGAHDVRYQVDFFWRELAVVSMLLTIRACAHDFMGVGHS